MLVFDLHKYEPHKLVELYKSGIVFSLGRDFYPRPTGEILEVNFKVLFQRRMQLEELAEPSWYLVSTVLCFNRQPVDEVLFFAL